MLRFFFGDELLVYVVVVLVCFFGNTRAQLRQLYRRLPQKRYYSARVSAEQQQQEQHQQQKQTSSFADLGVPKQIVDLLLNAGIEKPSVAQLAALPELIDLRKLGGEGEEDAKAWSVSMPSIAMQSHRVGKTLAYLIPICDILRRKKRWRRWIEIKEARGDFER